MECFVDVSRESGIPLKHLLELVQQKENGASVAFLARYRADLCGGLDEVRVHRVLRTLEEHWDLIDHRISMLATLDRDGVLTPELRQQLEQASDRRELYDLFAPYQARQRDSADEAIDQGIDPLARALWFQQEGVDIQAEAESHVNPESGVESPQRALEGAYAIAARWLGEKPEILRELRKLCHRDCELAVSALPAGRNDPRAQGLDGYRAKASQIAWQKKLAIRRGVRMGLLESRAEFPFEAATQYLERCLIKDPASAIASHLKRVVEATLRNGLGERVMNEALRRTDEEADAAAVDSCCKALRKALLAPCAHDLNIVGIETGLPGGWRAVLIDRDGKLIDHALIQRNGDGTGRRDRAARHEPGAQAPAPDTTASPPPAAPPTGTAGQGEEAAKAGDAPGVDEGGSADSPANHRHEAPKAGIEGEGGANSPANPSAAAEEAPAASAAARDGRAQGGTDEAATGSQPPKRGRRRARLAELSEILAQHEVDLVVFPAGPRNREVERFVRAQIRKSGKAKVAWLATNDRGTRSYSTSRTGRRELPRMDPAFRSAASLARRVQDPLAELVKIDPKMLAIGSHHHEVDGERLREALGRAVQQAVHDVGVDANRAPADLLALVPGLSLRLALQVVEHRNEHGPFRSREDLRKVEGLTDQIFAQAVGFLRVHGADPLDATGAHPEYRELYERFAETAGCDLATLLEEPARLESIDPEQFATEERSVEFVRATMEELKPSRRRIRDALELPKPVAPLRPDEELRPGSKVSGVVSSIADFGAFVDIGADQDGLLHVSQIRRDRTKDSKPNLQVGDELEVFVKSTDRGGKRISLSMRNPAVEVRPGSKVSGVVSSIADFGAFVDIGADQDGLLHVSQIKRELVKDSKPNLQVGDELEVFVKSTDRGGKRISLSMRNPAVEVRPGSKVSGVVSSIADFGAFVDIGAGQDGLLHVSQIKRELVKDSKPNLQVGDELEVFVKSTDQGGKRISLSMRNQVAPLSPDEELRPGSRVSGVVASIADFGAFVDIGAGQDGLLHISQIKRELTADSKPNLQVGDELEVFVKSTDQGGKRISLSMWSPQSRPPRDRNGSGFPPGERSEDGPRRRGSGRGGDRFERRKPFSRTFGPDSDERSPKRDRKRMSMQDKLDMLKDQYRTKI